MKTMLMNLKIIAWLDFWISNHDFYISHFDFTVSQFAISFHCITGRNQDIPMLSWGHSSPHRFMLLRFGYNCHDGAAS